MEAVWCSSPHLTRTDPSGNSASTTLCENGLEDSVRHFTSKFLPRISLTPAQQAFDPDDQKLEAFCSLTNCEVTDSRILLLPKCREAENSVCTDYRKAGSRYLYSPSSWTDLVRAQFCDSSVPSPSLKETALHPMNKLGVDFVCTAAHVGDDPRANLRGEECPPAHFLDEGGDRLIFFSNQFDSTSCPASSPRTEFRGSVSADCTAASDRKPILLWKTGRRETSRPSRSFKKNHKALDCSTYTTYTVTGFLSNWIPVFAMLPLSLLFKDVFVVSIPEFHRKRRRRKEKQLNHSLTKSLTYAGERSKLFLVNTAAGDVSRERDWRRQSGAITCTLPLGNEISNKITVGEISLKDANKNNSNNTKSKPAAKRKVNSYSGGRTRERTARKAARRRKNHNPSVQMNTSNSKKKPPGCLSILIRKAKLWVHRWKGIPVDDDENLSEVRSGDKESRSKKKAADNLDDHRPLPWFLFRKSQLLVVGQLLTEWNQHIAMKQLRQGARSLFFWGEYEDPDIKVKLSEWLSLATSEYYEERQRYAEARIKVREEKSKKKAAKGETENTQANWKKSPKEKMLTVVKNVYESVVKRSGQAAPTTPSPNDGRHTETKKVEAVSVRESNP